MNDTITDAQLRRSLQQKLDEARGRVTAYQTALAALNGSRPSSAQQAGPIKRRQRRPRLDPASHQAKVRDWLRANPNPDGHLAAEMLVALDMSSGSLSRALKALKDRGQVKTVGPKVKRGARWAYKSQTIRPGEPVSA